MKSQNEWVTFCLLCCCVQGHWPYSASEDQQTIRSAPASFDRQSFDCLESIQRSSWPRWAQCRPKTLIKSTIAFRRNFSIPKYLQNASFTFTKLHLSPVLSYTLIILSWVNYHLTIYIILIMLWGLATRWHLVMFPVL